MNRRSFISILGLGPAIPLASSGAMAKGSRHEINVPGADAATLARVEASVKELVRSIPKMVDHRIVAKRDRGLL